MFWNDIKELKITSQCLHKKLLCIESKVDVLSDNIESNFADISSRLTCLEEVNEKLEQEIPRLVTLINRDDIAVNYETHFKKISEMLLEFKGCVAIARASIAERKECDEKCIDIPELIQQLYNSMLSFIRFTENMENEIYKRLDDLSVKEKRPKRSISKKKKEITS